MAYEDEEDIYSEDEGQGMVSPLQMLMAGYSTVTPEGKAKAAEVFGDLYGKRTQYDEDEQSAYDEYEAQARAARETLRKAREVLAAKKTPSTRYLEMARGFGAPTRAGSFGESISNYADARIPGRQREAEWESNRDNQLLQFDQGMSEIDQALAMQRLKLKQARRGADDKLMIESMKIMGKPMPQAKTPPKTPERVAQEALDKAYVKDYVEFIQGGAADATKNIEELRSAHRALTKSDMKTGPIIGLVPKVLRDVFLPKASATQEAVESTVQRSLRQILGPQFTAKEGESLLARVYNPRLPEEINAVRVARLIEQLDRAYQEKIKAAEYFEQRGSLKGYAGKKAWSIGEFLPDDEAMAGDDDPRAIAGDIEATVTGGGRPALRQAAPPATAVPDAGMEEIPIEALLPARAQGGRVKKFAEGGQVGGDFPDGLPRFRMPDGKIVRGRQGDTYEFALDVYTKATGTAPTRPGLPPQQIPPRGIAEEPPVAQPQPRPPMAAAAGPDPAEQPPSYMDVALGEAPSAIGYTVAGAAGAGIGDKLLTATGDRLIPGRRETPAQRRILDMLQEQRRSPADVVAGVKQQQKMGIPAMAMDDPALRATADSVLPETGLQNASTILQRLNARTEGAGERTMERVNQGLKPDEYFDELDKLRDNLYENSKPLYQQAYAANPAVKSQVLPQLLGTPDGKKAVKMALRIMRNEGKKIGKQDAMGMVTKPSLEFLDYVKRGLDQLITKEEGSGVNYQATELGKSMRGLRNALRDELDVATTPAKGESLYKKAREQYAGDLEVLDSLQAGRNEFTKIQAPELQRLIGSMSFAEKDAYRTGVAQALFEQIESPTGDFNAARKVIGSPAMRKKLRVLFDNDKQFDMFETALKREAELYELDKKSTRRAESGQELHAEPREGMIKRGSRYVPRLGWKSPTMWVLQFIRNNQQATEKKMDDVLKHLKASSADELADLEKTLGPKYSRRLSRKGRAAKTAVAGALAGAAYKVAAEGDGDEEDEDYAEQE